MKILITGAGGQLGRELTRQASEHELILTDVAKMDISSHEQVREIFRQVRPEAVLHCAAYTQVDRAETDFDGAYRINVAGTRNVAAACLETDARMIYVSTDYVFDGVQNRPYREYDPVNPQSVYGRTKWLGEEMVRQVLGRHYILRTSWLYGEGHNFVRTMLKLAREKDQLQVVNDQTGSPTLAKDLARVMLQLIRTDAYGTYHVSGNGCCTWYEFACRIFQLAGISIPVQPVTTACFAQPARRPVYSVLDNYLLAMTMGDSMRHWDEALQEYLAAGTA
ncbi:MAG TPA: dTDP-4-dehydrorhamnose reductase [Patescibacteria group bacterium]|nr:dTDP-4-dehydrorhamnose reductase [Patescibacteria group bacterium]